MITSLYLFGDNENVKNSLLFLRKTMELQENTDGEWKWINWIPSYSAWWVINLCDYCTFTGNQEFFRKNREYALEILKQFDALISEEGAKGISTFMAYYILTAMAKTGGTQMLEILKQYYGGMLDKGATTFWEDFDIAWLENSSRIDEFPKEGQKDIHGDFGKFCYEQFRHSLCHGWSSGVLAFIVEYIVGLRIEEGGEKISVTPHLMGLTEIEAKIPLKNGTAKISIHGEDVQVSINKA